MLTEVVGSNPATRSISFYEGNYGINLSLILTIVEQNKPSNANTVSLDLSTLMFRKNQRFNLCLSTNSSLAENKKNELTKSNSLLAV